MSKESKEKKKREDLEDIEENLEDKMDDELEESLEDIEENLEDIEEDIEEKKEKKKEEIIPKQEFIKLKYQFSEFVNKYKDFEKEFENYKRRTREEIKEAREEGIAKAVKALLPALNTFKTAKTLIKDESSLSGVEMIEKSILAEFEKLGVKKIKCKGEKFDPEMHNAVMLVENSKQESGTVVDEVEAGFIMGEKVIKFSQVTVAK